MLPSPLPLSQHPLSISLLLSLIPLFLASSPFFPSFPPFLFTFTPFFLPFLSTHPDSSPSLSYLPHSSLLSLLSLTLRRPSLSRPLFLFLSLSPLTLPHSFFLTFPFSLPHPLPQLLPSPNFLSLSLLPFTLPPPFLTYLLHPRPFPNSPSSPFLIYFLTFLLHFLHPSSIYSSPSFSISPHLSFLSYLFFHLSFLFSSLFLSNFFAYLIYFLHLSSPFLTLPQPPPSHPTLNRSPPPQKKKNQYPRRVNKTL